MPFTVNVLLVLTLTESYSVEKSSYLALKVNTVPVLRVSDFSYPKQNALRPLLATRAEPVFHPSISTLLIECNSDVAEVFHGNIAVKFSSRSLNAIKMQLRRWSNVAAKCFGTVAIMWFQAMFWQRCENVPTR